MRCAIITPYPILTAWIVCVCWCYRSNHMSLLARNYFLARLPWQSKYLTIIEFYEEYSMVDSAVTHSFAIILQWSRIGSIVSWITPNVYPGSFLCVMAVDIWLSNQSREYMNPFISVFVWLSVLFSYSPACVVHIAWSRVHVSFVHSRKSQIFLSLVNRSPFAWLELNCKKIQHLGTRVSVKSVMFTWSLFGTQPRIKPNS